MSNQERDPRLLNMMELLLNTGSALISAGCSSNRVELLLAKLAHIYGFVANVFALPTGITISVKKGQEGITDLIRVRTWSLDLDKIDRINQLIMSIEGQKLDLDAATSTIKQLLHEKSPYPEWLIVPSQGMASFGLIFFLRGDLLECFCGFGISLVGSLLYRFAMRAESRRYLADFLTSATVTSLAAVTQWFWPTIDIARLVVGAIVVMLPGLVWVNSFHELAQKNLVSGAAKVFEAGMIGFSLWFGVMFGLEFVSFLKSHMELLWNI